MVEKIKQIKIDEDLFRMIYQYFIYGHKDETELIKAGLKDKMDKMILRNIYVVVKQNCYTWDGLISACALLRTESALHCMNVV